jgi:hypothetical protein
MTVTDTADQFTTLPDDETLAATVTALEEHGFSVEVVDTLAAARTAVLARIPAGSTVMTNTSVTLQETGIADAVNDGGPYESARNAMFALDFETQAQEMKAIGGQLKLEDARAQAAYGQHSYIGKILEIHQELPGRIHIVLVRQPTGF